MILPVDIIMLFFFSCMSNNLSFELGNTPASNQDTNELQPSMEPSSNPTGELNFYEDIRPILDQKCNACHWESGRSFSMLTHENPLVWSSVIARDIVDGGKPPPTPNPECQDYEGGNWHLNQDDIDTIVSWVEEGTPIGSEDNITPYNHWPSIGPFDQSFTLPNNVQIPRNEGYQCYAFPLTQEGIKGLQMSTNNEEYIHHSLVYLAERSTLPNTINDFSCSYSGHKDWSLIAGWRPGAPPMEVPDGITIGNNSHIVIQMYYTPPTTNSPSGDGPTFSWGALFTDNPILQVLTTEVTDFTVPAGEHDHIEDGTLFWEEDAIEIVGMMPRTHLLGMGVSASIQHADGRNTCLIAQEGYDFGMPHNLIFSQPPLLQQGDRIQYQCSWDNSEGNMRQVFHPPITFSYGYGENDGICKMSFLIRSQY